MSKTDQVWIPGKAYEIVTAAPFMTAKNLTDGEREARVALKEGEKRNKGRGYRVLVTLNPDAAMFLCDWFSEFQAGPGYKALGTAEALAIRTITDRICDFAGQCKDAKERRSQQAKDRAARRRAAKEAKAAQDAQEKREREQAELPRLKADIDRWADEYAVALEATKKAKTPDEIRKAFQPVERLQSAILGASARVRTLEGNVR